MTLDTACCGSEGKTSCKYHFSGVTCLSQGGYSNHNHELGGCHPPKISGCTYLYNEFPLPGWLVCFLDFDLDHNVQKNIKKIRLTAKLQDDSGKELESLQEAAQQANQQLASFYAETQEQLVKETTKCTQCVVPSWSMIFFCLWYLKSHIYIFIYIYIYLAI